MIKKHILGLFVLVFLVFPVLPLVANTGGDGADGGTGSGNTVVLDNPLGEKNKTFQILIKKLLDAAAIIGLPIAVLFIVLAGFRFIAARGNSTKLETARHNLLYTVIGIGIFFGAWVLANIIAQTLRTLGADI